MARWAWLVCVAVQVLGVALWLGGGAGEGAVGAGAQGQGEGAAQALAAQPTLAPPTSSAPEPEPEPPAREVAVGLVGARLEVGEVERALGEVERALGEGARGASGEGEAITGEVEVAVRGGMYRYGWEVMGAVVLRAGDEAGVRRLVDAGYVLREGERGGERVVFGLDGGRVRALLGGLAAVWERAPVDARWDFVHKKFVPHRMGLALELEASVEALLGGLVAGAGRVEVVVREVPPPARVDIGPLVGWEPAVQMGTLRTKYEARKKDRTHNLELAASFVDGVIIMPGQVVSYNEVVGERTLARGFREAPVIVHGEMLEGVGGGACQVSSTLYAVALLMGLDIVERSSHSLPSPYIDKGLDAVVSWPHLDLKIRNNYTFPVAVRAGLADGQVVVSMWGAEPARRVVIRREITEKLPFVERVEVTEELAPKQTKKVREGRFGYRVAKGRITWEEGGAEHFERMYEDVYLPRPRQVKIGPGTVYPEVEPQAASGGDDDALSVED